ncbi:MAG: EAL domain-containing protein [Comamonadaceae bacterium]|nr:EAL domain-containing protein [Comamonadaceae bacterium]
MAAHRILVVEDETIVARDICVQLQMLGYLVVGEARTGEQAVALARQLKPDLVLMDIQLASNMDGITAALAIRAEKDLPVVFLTAFAADDVLERAMLAEPYGYILKPFSDRELRTVLQMAFYKHQAEARAHDLAQQNQAILDNLASGVITLNVQGQIESINQGACTMFGYRADQVLGQPVSMLMPWHLRARHDAYLVPQADVSLDRVVCREREVEGQRQDGTLFPMALTVSLISRGGLPLYLGVLTDMSQRRRDEEKIHHLVFYDELTGLPNRRRLLDRLKLAVQASAQTGQHGALIFLDLDHFRHVNETLGPGHGDDLLREVSQRLPTCVREDDTVAHLGGDDFMVMLEELGLNRELAALHAAQVADKIAQALRQPYSLRGHHYSSSASIGIVIFDADSGEHDELLKMTDAAMYQAKEAGRNAVRFYDPAIQAQALARTQLEKDLQRGLLAQEFVLHFQVQVNARGDVLGSEALVRWMHPTLGLVPPAKFIPLAEQTGLILQLGQMVLVQACQQLALWQQQPGRMHWVMAVNVSSLQFAQTDFVDTVADALVLTGANPKQLKLELTESMLVVDVPAVIAKMSSLKALGVSFSLDDFGTGYSSLSYLKRLPMDQLKIDQSFVRDLLTDNDDAVLARAIVALGHNLGMTVIAEGVESAGQRDFLASIGCDAFQGYYFGRPVPSDMLVAPTEIEMVAT